MKSFVALALAASAVALPQSSTPAGCQSSKSGSFQISVVNVTSSSSKRSIETRQLSGTLTLTLNGGILKDQAGRQGYIAANDQFQFDQPIQAGALETSGFSVCSNGSLALGGSAIWYQCYSGNFYNLYDKSQGKQCNPIYIVAQTGSTAPVTQKSDGQPGASTALPCIPVSQISDGQPQAPTGVVSQISDGQPQAPTGVVSQISDGQPQAPTGVVSQISDGQPQAPTGVVSQISDGQPQAPTGVVSQISDGQPQAPTGVPSACPAPPVTQISDGQPQAPTGPVVTQISDGQPQAPTGNYSSPSATAPVVFPGAATTPMAAAGALAAGMMAMVAML